MTKLNEVFRIIEMDEISGTGNSVTITMTREQSDAAMHILWNSREHRNGEEAVIQAVEAIGRAMGMY